MRWVFNSIEKKRDASIDEVANEVKEVLRWQKALREAELG